MSAYTASSHWLVLVFFPHAWSFICPTEIRAFSARLEEFLYSRTCAVVFASTDSHHCLKAWNHTCEEEGGLGGVHVPLISDSNHKLSRDYGVLDEEAGCAQRGMFIIDPKGIVRNISVSDSDVGRSVNEALRLIDALAFKDEFGEGCPVDWKKGDAGIDYADKVKVEGPIELTKKTWSEWARPRLQRAWSNNSQRSVGTGSIMSQSDGLRLSGYHTPAPPSPLVSPTSAAVGAMERNMEAAMSNMNVAITN